MMNLKSARAMFLPVSIAAIVTSLFDFLFIVITQQRHFVIPPFRFGYCSLCYNIVKLYTSPPMVIMTAGGLEPPRQLPASSCQDYCGCQLHHAVAESGEGDLAKDCPSPKLPQLKRYHNLRGLSIANSTIYYYNITLGVRNGYLS